MILVVFRGRDACFDLFSTTIAGDLLEGKDRTTGTIAAKTNHNSRALKTLKNCVFSGRVTYRYTLP